MYVCKDCGSIVWEEIFDSAKVVKNINTSQMFESKIYTEFGNLIKKRCNKCKSENLLDLRKIDWKIRLEILNSLNDAERLEKIKALDKC